MRIDVVRVLPDDLLDEAWHFYQQAFDELRIRAVTRHVLDRGEFEALMRDKRFEKYVAISGGGVAGLAAITGDLDAVSGISQHFFAHRWPDLYAEQRIFYVEFTAAVPGRRGAGVFVGLVRALLERVTAVDGIAVLDICSHNETELALPDMIGLAARRVLGTVRQQRLDTQSYWLYEFPDASEFRAASEFPAASDALPATGRAATLDGSPPPVTSGRDFGSSAADSGAQAAANSPAVTALPHSQP
jgi:hypothetical protein